MNFLEAGAASPFTITNATQSQVGAAADTVDKQVTSSTERQLGEAGVSI